MYNDIKNKRRFEKLFENNKIIIGGEKAMKELSDWKFPPNKCCICQQKWFDMHFCKDLGMCNRCRNEKYKDKVCYTFSNENNMIPGPQPQCLKDLNDVEKAAIKLIKPSLHIYKRKGGGVGYSGNCISFAQDVCTFAKKLPWSVNDLPIIIIQSVNDQKQKRFFASGSKIRAALKELKRTHPDYKYIEINEEALSEYPQNGGYLTGITTIDDSNNDKKAEDDLQAEDDDLLESILKTKVTCQDHKQL